MRYVVVSVVKGEAVNFNNNLRKEKIDYSETMKNIVDIMFYRLTIN